MAEIEVFLQKIRRRVPKGDEFSMQDALVDAARVFCQKSWYVRRSVTFMTHVPETPKNVAISAGNAQVTLAWDPVPNALYYTVNAGTVSGQESPNLTQLGMSAGVVINLTNAQQYFFTVQAVNGVGSSLPSPEISATPLSSNSNAPAVGTPTISRYSQKLYLPADEQPIGIKVAQCGTWPLAPATPRDMDPKFGPGRPRAFSYAPNGHMMLYPPPNGQYEILVMMPVQPVMGAVQLPDEIAENYLEGIGYGALKELYSQPGTPWENPTQAIAMASMFDDEIQRAKRESLSDFQAGNMRVQPAPFIIRSIW